MDGGADKSEPMVEGFPTPTRAAPAQPTAPQAAGEEAPVPAASDEAPPTPVRPKATAKPGKKIQAIGAIINSADWDHLHQNLMRLNETLGRHKIPPQAIITVGNARNTMHYETNREWMKNLGGLQSELSPPAQFQVTLSPTYLIYTESGIVVLEAVQSLDRFISDNGEFLEDGSGDWGAEELTVENVTDRGEAAAEAAASGLEPTPSPTEPPSAAKPGAPKDAQPEPTPESGLGEF